MEIKLNISLLGFQIQIPYPLVHDRPNICFGGHFAAYIDAFDKSCIQIFPQGNWSNQRRAKDLTVLERSGKKERQSLVCHFLVFNGNTQMEVFPALAPIWWKALRYETAEASGHMRLKQGEKESDPFYDLINDLMS